jgi:hypothetical protein
MNVTFAMTTFHEGVLVDKSVKALREFHPKSTIVVLHDEETNLKVPELRGTWTANWMLTALATDADIIVKVDPDTRAYNTVSKWPESDVFGEIAPNWVYAGLGATNVVFGACIGFKRSAVKKILDSGYLLDKQYEKFAHKGVSIQDPIVTDVINRLGLSIGHWSGLHMRTRFKEIGTFDKKQVAFAHPVRN